MLHYSRRRLVFCTLPVTVLLPLSTYTRKGSASPRELLVPKLGYPVLGKLHARELHTGSLSGPTDDSPEIQASVVCSGKPLCQDMASARVDVKDFAEPELADELMEITVDAAQLCAQKRTLPLRNHQLRNGAAIILRRHSERKTQVKFTTGLFQKKTGKKNCLPEKKSPTQLARRHRSCTSRTRHFHLVNTGKLMFAKCGFCAKVVNVLTCPGCDAGRKSNSCFIFRSVGSVGWPAKSLLHWC